MRVPAQSGIHLIKIKVLKGRGHKVLCALDASCQDQLVVEGWSRTRDTVALALGAVECAHRQVANPILAGHSRHAPEHITSGAVLDRVRCVPVHRQVVDAWHRITHRDGGVQLLRVADIIIDIHGKRI
jgi:hypothetical protein